MPEVPWEGDGVSIRTQPNERRCGHMVERHGFYLPPCCPVTKNPQPNSTIQIKYRPDRLILEVAALREYIMEYVGGRIDVRSMEGMVQNISQDCANAVGVEVRVKAKIRLLPEQTMKLICKAWPRQ